MTSVELINLEFSDTLTSNIDGTTWYFYGKSRDGVSVRVYKNTSVDMWGKETFLDTLHFSIGNFLVYFVSNKERVSETFVKKGGDVGEPYSIVYPNFHMLETNNIDPFQ